MILNVELIKTTVSSSKNAIKNDFSRLYILITLAVLLKLSIFNFPLYID